MKNLYEKLWIFGLAVVVCPTFVFAQATPDNNTVGATTNYTFSMTLGALQTLSNTGTIRINFPSGFSLPSTMIATASTNIDGGFLPATPVGQTVVFTRDGTGAPVAGGIYFSIIIGTVTNITSPGIATLSVTTSAGSPLEPFQPSIAVGLIARLTIENTGGGSGSEITSPLNIDTDDDSQQFFAVGRDIYGNFVNDITASWNVIGSIGSVNATGTSVTLTATTVGAGVITATGSGFTDATPAINVSFGALDHVVVVGGLSGDGPAFTTYSMTTDETLQLHAAGYDEDNNYRDADVPVTWTVTNGIGTFLSSTGASAVFDAASSGIGVVNATPGGGVTGDVTGDITVINGALNYIRINSGLTGNTSEFGTDSRQVGQTRNMHASSYDADGNYLNDVSVTWSVTTAIGSVSLTTGISATFTATTPGQGSINASHSASGKSDNTGVMTVTTGAISSIILRNAPDGGGGIVAAVNISADDELTIYAAGYDSQNNFVSDVSVTWSASTGNLAPTISGTGSSYTFSPTTSGRSGRILATHASDTEQTGTITVSDGALSRVRVNSSGSGNQSEIGTQSLSADQTLSVKASGYDADGNYISDVLVAWSVSGGIGALSVASGTTTTLSASKVGDGVIIADHVSAIDDATGLITVTVGNLASIAIVEGASGNGVAIGTRSITTDQTMALHAAGFDADGNYTGDESVSWGVTSSIGSITPGVGSSALFDPTLVGVGQVQAAHGVGNVQTGIFTITAGALDRIQVLTGISGETALVPQQTIGPNDQVVVHAAGYDRDGNYIADNGSVSWGLTSPIGNLSSTTGISTTLTATTTGSSRIEADHSTAIDGSSGLITVATGSANSVAIRTAAGGQGVPVGALTLTTDDSVTVYAAGYDNGVYTQEVTVIWRHIGGLEPGANPTGSQYTFKPSQTTVTTGQIIADYSLGSNGFTGQIKVNPGKPSGSFTLSAAPATLVADNNSTATVTSSTIVDAEANLVGQNRQFTISASLGSITSADLDPIRPGIQVATNANSQLSFDFQAGGQSGSASITAVSVDGSAFGATAIAIGSLSINSIATSPVSVSRGQTGVQVTMSVSNLSAIPITGVTAGLTFSGSVNRDADYTVTPPAIIPDIGPSQTRSLVFLVDVSLGSALETITITGQVSGLLGGATVGVQDPSKNDSWGVQNSAQVTILQTISAVDIVQQGVQSGAFSVSIRNPATVGAAAIAIDSVLLKFRLKKNNIDFSSSFNYQPNPVNPVSIAAQTTAIFNFNLTQVFSSADTGSYVLDAEVYGKDANAANIILTDLTANVRDSIYVKTGDRLQVVDIRTLKAGLLTPIGGVTAGQTTAWVARMAVFNGSGDPIDLVLSDTARTAIYFRKGASPLTDFIIQQPTAFLVSGTLRIAGGATDSLDFVILKTSNITASPASISGKIGGTVVGGGSVSDDKSNITLGQININSSNASVFVFSVSPVAPSSNTSSADVNTGQLFKIAVEIKNDLQEDVANVLVQLTSDNSSIIPLTQRLIPLIPENETLSDTFDVQASITPIGEEVFSARILSAFAVDQQANAVIGASRDSATTVTIVNPAQLSVSFDPVFKKNQTAGKVFTVGAIVSKGESPRSEVDNSGQLTLTIPPAYVLQPGFTEAAGFTNIDVRDKIAITWDVLAPLVGQVNPDSFIVSIASPPLDQNTGLPAVVAVDKDTQEVVILDIGLALTDLSIISPAGAKDSTLSTRQDFTLQATVNQTEIIKNTNATLEERAGFKAVTSLVQNPFSAENDSTLLTFRWVVNVDTDNPFQDTLIVTIGGVVQGTAQTVRDTMRIPLTVLTRPDLEFTSFRAVNLPGLDPVRASVGQEFTLQALIGNNGQAGVEGSGELQLDLSRAPGITLVAGENASQSFVPGIAVLWRVKASAVPTDLDTITANITSLPKDENFNSRDVVLAPRDRNRSINIVVGDAGVIAVDSVWVSSPPGAAESQQFSTSQTFTINAKVRWDNVYQGLLKLNLPDGYEKDPLEFQVTEGFGVDGERELIIPNIRVPFNARTEKEPIILFTEGKDDSDRGKDANTDADTLFFSVVNAAVLNFSAEIDRPESAKDTRLTVGQEFVIKATLGKNLNSAPVTGTDEIEITVPANYKFKDMPESVRKDTLSVSAGGNVEWTLVAPDAPHDQAALISVNDIVVSRNTRDVYTGLLAPLTDNVRKVQIAVTTRGASLTAKVLSARTPSGVPKGAKGVGLFGLEFSNTDDDTVLVSSILLSVKSNGSTNISPNGVLSGIKVVDYSDSVNVFLQLNSMPGENPLTLNFSPPLAVFSSTPRRVEFLVDLLAEPTTNNFMLYIANANESIVANVLNSIKPVEITNENGTIATDLMTEVEVIGITESGFTNSFLNYPNPFGYSDRPETIFNYNLLENSKVNIRIYTLLGRLVWSSPVYEADTSQGRRGGHDNDIKWDGKNDKGYDVISGIYVAVITTNQGTASTKIAVAR